ncbi:dTDP-glucose 4,6-dehydratase [Robertmurraya kyonggiensis]|uniref:dTDP-glucose 4,6-dehydratase n=1 Tax=Robertmurraya kyonggiensis TaxID=1037680 RepID=A0A4V5P3Y3_9BACI|nr:dTDP-glucose 4,6-dehydratase [Robertmurraya kyonggiensis]TKC15500.1 dTDP-glucose 4,6-dehydratase [Robertmurraya kyonggiensis]
MNILVTGGAGFIGSNFIKYMLARYDYRIINIDALTYAGNLENLKDIETHQRYHFVKGDICDRGLVEELFEKYKINSVINFAAQSHVDRSIEDPEIFLRTNVFGTQILLEVSKDNWKTEVAAFMDGVRFIQISTDEVYGTLGKDGYFTERTSLAPNSPYSASKAAADFMVRAYFETYGLPINITRCSNNYGPYQHPEKLIPLTIKNAMMEKAIPIYGDGRQIRDWLYVLDHCRAIDMILHKGKLGEVYNIGGNNEKINVELVKLILSYLEKSEDLLCYVQDRLGHDRRYAIDNFKITNELGWRPLYTFEEGIKRTIDWYKENADWFEDASSFSYVFK